MTKAENSGPRSALNPLPEQRRDVALHELDGEALIYDPIATCTHQLNSTALFIWRQCDGAHHLGQISEALATVYDVSDQEAMVHSERLITELTIKKLLVSSSEEAPTHG